VERSGLVIIIPALNEATTISEIIEKASHFGNVIVADDGSTDGTAEVAVAAGAKVVRHETNRGYDAALNSGFAKAAKEQYAAAITMDADGEHDPEILSAFSRELETHPLVLGVRPRKQRASEILMGLYFRYRYGISDILCGMKGYQMSLYEENGSFDHINSIGTELTLKAIMRGHQFCQVNVPGRRRRDRPRFGSVIRGNWLILKALTRVLQIKISV